MAMPGLEVSALCCFDGSVFVLEMVRFDLRIKGDGSNGFLEGSSME